MDLNEKIAEASAGSVDAMAELVDHYIDAHEWNEAIDWADKAAETGNCGGMFKAAGLHNLRMSSLLSGGMPFWGTMKEDAQAVQKNAAVLLGCSQNGLIDLDQETYSDLLTLLKEALYCEAVTCYCDVQNADIPRVIHLLKDVDGAREQALCGLCHYEMKQYDDSLRILDGVYRDPSYVSESKVPSEQAIFSMAMLAFSSLSRVNGEPEKSVTALNRGIDGITDEDMKAPLRKELNRYHKKMFGGWKYA